MSTLSLVALRAFDVAARLGSFKAAANAMNVSATAISHHIRGLEAQIGVALFTRGTRQVSLTDAGRRLAEATSTSFARIEIALDELKEMETTLTISTTPAFAALWLAPRLGSFETRHHDICLRLVSSTEVTDLRKDQSVDIAIRYVADEDEIPGAVPLVTEYFQAFGSQDYVQQLVDLPAAQFIETNWVSKSLKPVTWRNWFEAAGEPPAGNAGIRKFHQENEVLQAGLSGQGLILLSNVLAGDAVSRTWLTPYRPDIRLGGFTYHAFANPQKRETNKVKYFLSWLLEVMTQDLEPPK